MFEPWIGKQFGLPQNALRGLKLLVVGESHYTEDDEWVGKTCPTETKDTIQKLALNNNYRYFSKLYRLIHGGRRSEVSADEAEKSWHSIAFYNFIPVFLKKGSKPTPAQWRAGKDLFPGVLDQIQPEAIIVNAVGVWWWVMDALPGGEAANPSNRDFASIRDTLAVRTQHVSSIGYRYENERPKVEKLLAEVRSPDRQAATQVGPRS